MRKGIAYEKSQKEDIYLDITDIESLIPVAFGMLAKEFGTPMHVYDIPNGELLKLDDGFGRIITESVKKHKAEMTLD